MSIKIKMISDYICPFCYMGKGVINKLKDEYDMDIEMIGLEIHPDTKPEGNDLRKQFPGAAEHWKLMNERGKEFGISYGEGRVLPNSHKALILAEYARENGKIEEYSMEVFNSYFSKGKNIGEDKVLTEIAQKLEFTDFDLNTVLKDKKIIEKFENNLKEVNAYRIRSVPTFIINDKYQIVGAQDISEFRRVFDSIK